MILNIVLGLLLVAEGAAFISHKRVIRPAERRSSKNNAENSLIVKLPILQIYKGRERLSEVIYGADPELSQKKITHLLDYNAKQASRLAFPSEIQNLYSDDQLHSTLEKDSDTYYFLKLYEINCNKCLQFEPIYADLHRQYGDKLSFLQARASDLPSYTYSVYQSLLGLNPNSIPNDNGSEVLLNCGVCMGSGSVQCSGCNGLGYVARGSLAVFCPDCSGKKRVRCNVCGGKCLNC